MRKFMTIDAARPQFTDLTDRLISSYPDATRAEVAGCVTSAEDALGYFGASDDADMMAMAERIAERELRLRLGLEREIARLDPEDHHR